MDQKFYHIYFNGFLYLVVHSLFLPSIVSLSFNLSCERDGCLYIKEEIIDMTIPYTCAKRYKSWYLFGISW